MDIVAQKKVKGQEEKRFQSIQDSLQDIKIPRARCSSFTSRIIPRFKRRQRRIGHLISRIHLLVFQQGM